MPIDHTQFQPAKTASVLKAAPWWAEKETPHEAVWRTFKALEEQQKYRAEEFLHHARLYGNRDLAGLGLGQYTKTISPEGYKNRVAMNVVKACVDTVTAKIAKNRPRPMYLTKGGEWGQRVKAKALNKFTEGAFHETRIYEVAPSIVRDAEVGGTGVYKVFELNGRIAGERVLPTELFVDDAEAIHGDPRTLMQVKTVSREVLAGMFADDAKKLRAIEEATPADTEGSGQNFLGDMVQVVEAWHLPSAKDAGDGRHLITLDTGVLIDEEWTKTYFPFAFLRWTRPMVGFWGEALAGHLSGLQLEINKLLQRIQRMMHFSVPRVFLLGESKVPKDFLSNKLVEVIALKGTNPPVFSVPSMVPPEYFNHLERLYAKAFEEAGVSRMSAGSQKPAGLNSAVALREYNDVETERFVTFAQAYEQFFLDAGRMMVDLARDIATRDDEEGQKRGYKVKLPSKREVQEIDWSEIDLGEDDYVMQAYPVSSLPSQPAAKQDAVVEWVQQGWVTPEEGRRLLDFPDLEQSTNLAVAALNDIDFSIDSILEEGEYQTPEPEQALELGLKRFQSAYLKARSERYPDDRREMLLRWMAEARALLADAQSPEAPVPAPPGGAPDAAALPPPPDMPAMPGALPPGAPGIPV